MNRSVIRAKVQLMLSKAFFGSLAARLELRETKSHTFATDGKYLFVPDDKYFVAGPNNKSGIVYNEHELEAVIAHEVAHCAFLHLFRKGNRDHLKWNIACDFAINWMLKQEGYPIHAAWCYDEKFAGMTAEKIYSLLPNITTIKLPNNMDDMQEPNKDGENDTDEQSGYGGDLEGEWKDAVAHAAEKSQGKLPAGFEEYIKDLINPKIPWQQTLMRFLQSAKGTNDFVSYPFNRAHIYRGVYLPSTSGERIELICAVDTSGSISSEEFTIFLSEILGICQAFGEYKIYFMQCDAKVHEFVEIEAESELPMKMKGRGGTDFRPVFDKAEEMELDDLPIVYFTDLCGSFPDKARPNTFWVAKAEYAKQFKAPFGEIIEYN